MPSSWNKLASAHVVAVPRFFPAVDDGRDLFSIRSIARLCNLNQSTASPVSAGTWRLAFGWKTPERTLEMTWAQPINRLIKHQFALSQN
jgi:hypothetical protein